MGGWPLIERGWRLGCVAGGDDIELGLVTIAIAQGRFAAEGEIRPLWDLLVGGEHLNNPRLARAMAEDAHLAPAIAEGHGQLFRRDPEGNISLSHLLG